MMQVTRGSLGRLANLTALNLHGSQVRPQSEQE